MSSFSSRRPAFHLLTLSVAILLGFLAVSRFHVFAVNDLAKSEIRALSAAPATGLFYTVTATADNTDAVIHRGSGTAADPYQMSSLRGAVLNANTQITATVGPITISVPSETYQLSVNNPFTPDTTGTIDFPDLEVGSVFFSFTESAITHRTCTTLPQKFIDRFALPK